MTIISNCTATVINEAAASLIRGNLVAFPTETVYGLGADATNKEAIARIYEVKGRPVGHPLIVHISSMAHLDKWARDIPEYAIKLASSFWPGPMTLILPRTALAKDFITGGQDNVGIRVPLHSVAIELLKEFEFQGGAGVAAPSANRFGAVSPTTAKAVELELDNYLSPSDQILDGGSCEVGIESTIINCTEDTPIILRPGAITNEMIQEVLEDSYKIGNFLKNKIKAPGLLTHHYSPKAKIFLSGQPSSGDGFIALDSISTPNGAIRLASPVSVEEYAKILYVSLRSADINKISKIFVVPPEGNGLAHAVNDRLQKASNSHRQND
jgi:L-threonylcarbamoyladenylate synthase